MKTSKISKINVRKRRIGLAAAAVVLALAGAGCVPTSFSGSATGASAIEPGAQARLEASGSCTAAGLSLECSTLSVSGTLVDEGTSDALPGGVDVSFAGTLYPDGTGFTGIVGYDGAGDRGCAAITVGDRPGAPGSMSRVTVDTRSTTLATLARRLRADGRRVGCNRAGTLAGYRGVYDVASGTWRFSPTAP